MIGSGMREMAESLVTRRPRFVEGWARIEGNLRFYRRVWRMAQGATTVYPNWGVTSRNGVTSIA